MAFGTNSKVFLSFIEDVLENTTAIDLNTDTFKVALYNNTGTPDQTVASASAAYNAGQWVTGNEVTDGTNWHAGGESLTSVTSGFSSNVYTFDAANTPQAGATTTLANVYGCLIYDFSIASPVAKQALSYHAFGGAQGVTAGSFTVIYNASGIIQLTF